MPCLYCLTAHRRGRFWFCNRCGELMLLCPVPAHEISPPGTDGRAADAGERARHVHEAERSLLEAVRRLKLRQEAAAGPLDAPRPVGPDVADAVVLDLDAARRARQERTL